MSVFNKRREFVRFILVGVLATATHYGIYFFLCVLMLPAIAYTIGYAISFILNFYLSNVFTFNTKPTVRKGIGFGISHFVNYLLHIGLLSLFIWIGVPERWAPLPVFALVVPVNFLLVRFVLKSKKNMSKVSVLIPAYNEELSLPELYSKLKEMMDSYAEYEWEILFVNDGSHDKTLEVIKFLRSQDERINFVDLSRNFGKEVAMLAGFDYATGDCLVIMDADLQHPPHLIPEMLKYWEEGYDDVYAKRITRGKESLMRKYLSLLFYKLLQKTTRVEILPNVGDFRLLDRCCINALKQLRESQRYTKGMYCWIGFRKKEIKFEQEDRVAGTSSFNFFSLLGLAVEGVTSFTVAPLRISTFAGIIVSLVAFIYMCFIMFKTLIWGEVVQGFPTLMVVILFLGGIQLLSLGVIGEYIGRIFNETKNRPTYIAREYNGVKQ